MGNSDKAVVKSLTIVIGGLVALAVVVFVLAQQLAGPAKIALKDSEMNVARVGVSVSAGEKVRVAAKVVAKKVVAKKVVAKKTAKELGTTCMGCHATGVAGAPKVGDKAVWAPRAKLGVAALVASVVKGKGAMPPKGATALSDADITIVVKDMLKKSGL